MAGAPLLFGGSFDPIHLGHLIAAEFASEAFADRPIWFVPAGEQPFKVGRHGATGAHRLRMLQLAIDGRPEWLVEPIELERPGPSYTVETLRALGPRLGRRPQLLVGSDVAQELPTWREADAVLEMAEIVVYKRAGSDAPSLSYPAQRISVPLVGISGTEIRARVEADRSIRYLVPEAVRAYIARHGLYQRNVDAEATG
jgi:nicotinate-nucleotide adenylyltransferase